MFLGFRSALICLVTIGATWCPVAAEDWSDPFSEFTAEVENLTRTARPYLVQVMRRAESLSPDAETSPRIIGTGISLGDGWVLTSASIVGPALEVEVRTPSQEGRVGIVRGVDRRTNVAVLEVMGLETPAIPVATETFLFPGDVVLAVGLGPDDGPWASFGTVVLATQGPHLGYSEAEMVEVTAPAFPGITGGVLFSRGGEMVGMISGHMGLESQKAILPPGKGMVSGYWGQNRLTTSTPSSVTLALPAGVALEIAEELRVSGRIRRGYLGLQVELAPVRDHPSQGRGGVLVQGVVSDGPASVGGLIAGDIILKYADAKVVSPEDLFFLVAATRPESTVRILLLRKGVPTMSFVHIAQAPDLNWLPSMDASILASELDPGLASGGQ